MENVLQHLDPESLAAVLSGFVCRFKKSRGFNQVYNFQDQEDDDVPEVIKKPVKKVKKIVNYIIQQERKYGLHEVTLSF